MRNARRLWVVAAAGLVAGAVALAGCGGQKAGTSGGQPAGGGSAQPAQQQAQSGASMPTIRFGFLGSTNQFPIVIAAEKGFYEKNGVKVELTQVAGAPTIVEGIVARTFDGGGVASVPFLISASRGGPLVVVASGGTIVKGSSTHELLVRKDSPIQKLADLKGKIIAVNTRASVEMILLRGRVLPSLGLTEKDVTFLEIPFPQMAAALKGGKVDAIAAYEPFVTGAKKEVETRTLTDFTEFHPPQGFPLGLVEFHKDFIASRPEAVRSFVKAYVEAIRWSADHPDEALAIMSKRLNLKLDLLKSVRREHFDPRGAVDTAALEEVGKLLVALKLVDKPVALQSVINQSFLP